jgi:hypothetical protein
MRRLCMWVVFAVAIVAAIAGLDGRARAAAAPARCNPIITNQLQAREQGYQAHPSSAKDFDTRFADLQQLIVDANTEQEILTAVCASNVAQLTPMTVQLGITRALTRVVEADMAPQRFGNCAGEKSIVAGFLADGWLQLANTVPKDSPVPPAVAKVAPEFQTRAAENDLTLPAFADTTSYWVKSIQDKGKQAVTACAAQQ